MLVHEGSARTVAADRRLAWSLAGIAGALNAAGFYAVGLYASNMTGNISAVADHVGAGHLSLVLIPLGLAALFVFGAFLSTLLINAGRRRRIRGVFACSIAAEGLLLAGCGCLELRAVHGEHLPLLLFALSFLMGVQNATVTQISNARVRTTHVTGMVTDIGIEFANLIDLRGGPTELALDNAEKLRLHLITVVSFVVGGIGGVLIFRGLGGASLLFVAGALLLALAAPALRAPRFPDHAGRP